MEEKIREVAGFLEIPIFKVAEAIGISPKPCLAKTIEEASSCCRGHHFEEKRSAFIRWDELSLIEGEKNFDIPTLKKNWEEAPNGGKAQKFILDKLRKICAEKLKTASFLEAKEIHAICQDNKTAELVIDRMIDQASNQDEAIEAYNAAEALHNYDLELLAIKKIYDFTEL